VYSLMGHSFFDHHLARIGLAAPPRLSSLFALLYSPCSPMCYPITMRPRSALHDYIHTRHLLLVMVLPCEQGIDSATVCTPVHAFCETCTEPFYHLCRDTPCLHPMPTLFPSCWHRTTHILSLLGHLTHLSPPYLGMLPPCPPLVHSVWRPPHMVCWILSSIRSLSQISDLIFRHVPTDSMPD
jgi:hypothetical protein